MPEYRFALRGVDQGAGALDGWFNEMEKCGTERGEGIDVRGVVGARDVMKMILS